MSDAKCLLIDQDDLRRKCLSFKKKLIYSKYNRNKRKYKSFVNSAKKSTKDEECLEENSDESIHIEEETSEEESESKRELSLNMSHYNKMNQLNEMDSIQVSCNNKIGHLFKEKFGSGGKGKCIRVINDDSTEKWLSNLNSFQCWIKYYTPIEFETYAGKGSCRDWKRTIKVGGISLMNLIESELLICHAVSCSCAVCNQNTDLIGPIRPMIKYRRRKKDEILAQNAYKKFLSLKPPTILAQKLQKISNINQKKPSLCLSLNDSNSKILMNESSTSLIQFPITNNKTNDSIDVFNKALNELQEIESKQWSLIENESKNLMTQVQNFQLLIQETKKQMELNRQNLLKQFLKN